MRKYFLIGLLFMVSGRLFAQDKPQCGYDEFIQNELEEHPSLLKEIEIINREAAQWNSLNVKSTEITIPVVVHVLYNDASQNISDEQVRSQIRVLNRDYNRMNSDRSKTPAPFQSVAASCDILFCLASLDPNGQPTSGITRTFTAVKQIGAQGSNSYYSTANGGQDIWNRDHYLNIWVCDVGSSLLGYSTTPSLTTAQDKDGLVIGYQYFGTEGPVENPNDLGRTTTHEVGHWLGLDHLWGSGDPSGNNCGFDDGIADTPNQRMANYGCPSFPDTSCMNGPNGDMFMNYMDYTDDDCMNLFTEGQKARMLSILNSNPRKTLFTSPAGCSYTGENKLNAAPNEIQLLPNPSSGRLKVEFANFSSAETTVELYHLNGQLISTQEIYPESKTIKLDYELMDGIYTLHLKQSERHFVKKLVIQNP